MSHSEPLVYPMNIPKSQPQPQVEFSRRLQEDCLDRPGNGQGQKDVLHVGAQCIGHGHTSLARKWECNWLKNSWKMMEIMVLQYSFWYIYMYIYLCILYIYTYCIYIYIQYIYTPLYTHIERTFRGALIGLCRRGLREDHPWESLDVHPGFSCDHDWQPFLVIPRYPKKKHIPPFMVNEGIYQWNGIDDITIH